MMTKCKIQNSKFKNTTFLHFAFCIFNFLMTRIAALHVLLFPLAARLRSEPELLHEAVVVTQGNGSAAWVVAATRRARKGGVRAGLSLPQARAIFPKLIARARDAECERSAQEALLEVAERFSPRVEDAGEGIVYLDLTGLERQWKRRETGDGNRELGRTYEHDLANAAIRAAADAGLPLRAGVAASKLAARIAAELPETPTIVPPGGERDFLAPLPLARLTPEMAIAATLHQWGIHSIGELAHLPEGEVASRLGETGRALHWSARGVDPRPLIPRSVPQTFEEGMDLEWPLVALEPFVFVANAALDRLAKRLETHGLACKQLQVALRLEPDGFYDRTIELPAPTRDVKTMLTLVRLDLEANPPGAPVAGFTLTAHPDKPRRAQLSLFGPPALSPDKLATSIARIASMVGVDRVGTPATVDGYRPERFGLSNYDPPPPPIQRRAPKRGRGLLAIRVLRPALPVEVTTRGAQADLASIDVQSIATKSAAVQPADPARKGKPFEVSGPVRVASGPWTLEEGWWSDEEVQRDYWDVELVNGGVYRVFRERASTEWFVDGVYD
jgi:protein ImuB